MPKHVWSAWGKPAKPAKTVLLQFSAKKPRKGLSNFSAGARLGDSLFLAADEYGGIDRLTRGKHGKWAGHARFELSKLLPLADPDGEVDLEGLAADEDWLWVLGSHARTRPKPEKMAGECIDLDQLADLKDTRSRCLLGRLPLVERKDGWRPVKRDLDRHAGMIPQTGKGGALSEALAADPLIGPFTCIPAKEGGLDIEGIAVCGDRIALGMRGPVIATHALIVEIAVAEGSPGELVLTEGPTRRLLAMEGLGIRDLKRNGDDLLILAGPTTGLSGPCAIYRWPGWANDPAHDPAKVHLHRPERLLELPFGRGEDHPEGLALWTDGPGPAERILVVYDNPSDGRIDLEDRTVIADIFDLPK